MSYTLTAAEAEQEQRELDENRELRKNDINLYRARQADIRDGFAAYLAEDNFTSKVPVFVANAVFEKSWADGHASGYESVENEYVENAQLVQLAIDTVTSGK